MARRHTLVIALVLAAGAIAGTLALTNTIRVGQASGTSASAATTKLVAKRTAQLDRFEAALRRRLAEKPPALPAAPGPASAAAADPRRVVYVRPAPIVVHGHASGGEHESESGEHGEEAGGDD